MSRQLAEGQRSASTLALTDSAQALGASSNFSIGILLKAHKDNSGLIAIGFDNTVTLETDTTDGYTLAAGEELKLEIADMAALFVIATDADQKLHVIGY